MSTDGILTPAELASLRDASETLDRLDDRLRGRGDVGEYLAAAAALVAGARELLEPVPERET